MKLRDERLLELAGIIRQQKSKYWWKVTKDYFYDSDPGFSHSHGLKSAVGTIGPSGADTSIKTNKANWLTKDDDGNKMYAGEIYGDYDGTEPLEDFAKGDVGATEIFINGKRI